MSITIDIDTGGTFTDGYVVRDGASHAVKVLTTPHDLAVCFRDVIESAAAALETTVPDMLRETASVRYATTVGTNAIIQRRGPRLGLMAGGAMPADDGAAWGVGLFVEPEMVRRVKVSEPSSNGGSAGTDVLGGIRGLLDDSARGLVAALDAEAGGEAGESHVREAFEEHYPLHCLDAVPLLLASDITPDGDDARRTATALFNAYVHPTVADYLYRAEDYLRDQDYRHPLLIVHNDGGCARVAKTIAGKTYNSGPMAGLLGGRAIARLYDLPTLVTLDMGGTSLDVGIVQGGDVPMREHGDVENVTISFPLPDLLPLGAGGGSIAWLDDDRLRVGPQSAGAKPGPACFGFGGSDPTVTDADVVLGILRPEAFLGGSMPIDEQAARDALRRIAEPLGCEIEEAAERVRATVHAEMGERLASELRRRGVDPAATTVLAFGGNGATHCAGIAQAAGARDVITLPLSPVFSAFGASMAGEPEGAPLEFDLTGSETNVAGSDAAPQTRDVRWPGHGPLPTAIHARGVLAPDARIDGPALVDSATTTCAVPPGWSLQIDEHGAERLTHGKESS
jgi:N-methylhydantoinase A/oxoprolinase/acetone carboxylase beta subunit